MAAVRAPKGYRTFYLGAGKVVHAAQDSDTTTLCKKPITTVKLSHYPYINCTQCAKTALTFTNGEKEDMPKSGARLPWRLTFQYATQAKPSNNAHYSAEDAERAADEMVDTAARRDSSVTITISNRDTGESYSYPRTDGEKEAMPPKKKTEAAPADVDVDALISDVHATIDQINEITPGDEGAATLAAELKSEAETKILQLPTNKRTALRSARDKAYKAAITKPEPAAAPAPAPAAEVATISDDPMKWAHVPELIATGVEKMREGTEAGMKLTSAGEVVANVLLTIRQNMVDPETGLPDLPWRMKATRNAASKVYDDALKGVSEDDVDRRAAHASLIKATQNKASDVLVAWLRGYTRDDIALLREIFPAAAAAVQADEELTPEAAIRKLYADKGVELPLRGRTEQMRINRRVDAIVSATKELETAKEAEDKDKAEELEGKISDLKADLPADALEKLGETETEKSDADKTSEALERAWKAIETAGKRAKKLKGNDKRKVKAELYKRIRLMAEDFDLDLSALVPADTDEA
ncbi:hypothetical protein [Streptomyces sp. NPDC048643]|uniref:hypothetical protein n=1 Tax=Streptomyces sp. NPDC048643 TaxID=3155637 RepID=UPI00342E55AF